MNPLVGGRLRLRHRRCLGEPASPARESQPQRLQRGCSHEQRGHNDQQEQVLDHVNPEEPAREYVNGGRISEKDNKDSTQEVGTTPEPAVPLISTGTGQFRGSRGTGGLPLLRFDEYLPPTKVQDFGDKAPEKYNG